jgi:hypothetical protein
MNKIMIEKRPRTYKHYKQYKIRQHNAPPRVEEKLINTSKGWEIVKEIKVCLKCYKEYKNE